MGNGHQGVLAWGLACIAGTDDRNKKHAFCAMPPLRFSIQHAPLSCTLMTMWLRKPIRLDSSKCGQRDLQRMRQAFLCPKKAALGGRPLVSLLSV